MMTNILKISSISNIKYNLLTELNGLRKMGEILTEESPAKLACANVNETEYSLMLPSKSSSFSLSFLVQSLSCVKLFATLWTVALGFPCPSPSPRIYSNPCPLNQ